MVFHLFILNHGTWGCFSPRLFLFFVFKSHAVGWYYQDSVAAFLARYERFQPVRIRKSGQRNQIGKRNQRFSFLGSVCRHAILSIRPGSLPP